MLVCALLCRFSFTLHVLLNTGSNLVPVDVTKRKSQESQSENDMRRQFGYLVTKTRDSIEKRISVGDFAVSILALGAYDPPPQGRDRSLLDEHSEKIKKAESVSAIFSILSAYWNYLNYEILEYIIKLYGTDDDTERLKSYNEKLHKFWQPCS